MSAGGESSTGASKVTIRKLAISDVPAVAAILEESPQAASWSQESLLQLASTGSAAWVADVTGAGCTCSPPETATGRTFTLSDSSEAWIPPEITAGFLIGRTAADEFEILNMAVSRKHRRIGIGTRLLESALQFSRNVGSERAYLEVRASNAPAIALYTRHRFTECGRRPNYYRAPTEDALLLFLPLSQQKISPYS